MVATLERLIAKKRQRGFLDSADAKIYLKLIRKLSDAEYQAIRRLGRQKTAPQVS
jgi:hypothetical protein